MRKINQYRNTYYKELAASVTLLFCIFLILASHDYSNTDVYVAPVKEVEQPVIVEVVVLSERDVIIAKIKTYFPRNAETMVAIAQAESHLNPGAVNYNCYYNKDETVVYSYRAKSTHSTQCKPSHRTYAWSVDCGILQRNYVGKICPVTTIDQHLQDVAELSRKQGLQAWAAYNSGAYLRYMNH